MTLNFTWWGNDDRAARYESLIEKFNEEYPNITINGTFTDFPSYWEKRQTEAAGGGLPDVWQFSDSYLRQYAEPGLLLDLDTVADYIDFDAFDEALQETGQLEGVQYSLPTGYSAWSVFQNNELLDASGIDAYEGGTSWEEYSAVHGVGDRRDRRRAVRRHRLHAAHPELRGAAAPGRRQPVHRGWPARLHRGAVGRVLGVGTGRP